MLGDGYSGAEFIKDKVKYKGSPSIVGIDKEVFNEVEKACKQLDILCKENKNQQNIPQLVLGKNNWFREFLLRSGVDIGKNKFINDNIKSIPKEKLSYLLSGLFDTDGHVEKRGHIGYSSISKKLIKDIQFCLYQFNIVSRIRKRKNKTIKISQKEYQCKDSYELLIAEKTSIFNFHNSIQFKIKRKQETLNNVVEKLSQNTLYKKCNCCNYYLYKYLFSGRTKEQKGWGETKLEIINQLEKNKEITSNELKKIIKKEIRKNSSRLNHHYELIKKEKKHKYDWTWSLNEIGLEIAKQLKKYSYDEIFQKDKCIICDNFLEIKLRNSWKNSNKENDIFWDQIREIKFIKEKTKVYDLVLPSDNSNDHMFVAEGFITHNSAGLNLPAYKVIIKDYKRYTQRGYSDIPVLEFHQMAGRAGRPGKETIGKSVLCVKSEDELEKVVPKYVFGNPEEIISKLAVEPTLKMYILSLMSMDIINTKEEIIEFFSSTFYAHQYHDFEALKYNIFRIIEILKDYDFVEQEDDYYFATPLGKKVSQLYLNPDTANYFLEHIDKFIKVFSKDNISKHDTYSLIYFIVNTMEMRPVFNVSKTEGDHYARRLEEVGDFLILGFDPFEMDYGNFLSLLKTSDVLFDWIGEAPEDFLNEKYKVTPGELNYKVDIVDWLLYCLEELSLLKKNFYFKNFISRLRQRFKHGIKEELLALVALKGVGRVRARKLYSKGLKTIADLKKAEFEQISKVVGDSIAIKIKRQITQSFDEELILSKINNKPKQIKVRQANDEENLVTETNQNQEEKQNKQENNKEERKEKSQKGLSDYF